MTVVFEHGNLVCEIGGDGTGLTGTQAVHFAHDMRDEHPGAIVAILPAKKSWLGGWPWQKHSPPPAPVPKRP